MQLLPVQCRDARRERSKRVYFSFFFMFFFNNFFNSDFRVVELANVVEIDVEDQE